MENEVTYVRMSGALGSLLLLWSSIERETRNCLARIHGGDVPKSAFGIASALSTWEEAMKAAPYDQPLRGLLASQLRSQLQRPLEIRNGLCHGLRGISSGRTTGISSGSNDCFASLTWELNGSPDSITWHELQLLFSNLDRARRAISMISAPHKDIGRSRFTDSPENREWWRTEFKIDLP